MPNEQLWRILKERELYTKSYTEFEQQFSAPEQQAKLHAAVVEQGLYTKDLPSFQQQFFTNPEKKNPSPSDGGTGGSFDYGAPGATSVPAAGTNWLDPAKSQGQPVSASNVPAEQPNVSPWDIGADKNASKITTSPTSYLGPVTGKTTKDATDQIAYQKKIQQDYSLLKLREERGGDYEATGDEIALRNNKNADELKKELTGGSYFERLINNTGEGTLRQYEWELTALQKDASQATEALESINRSILSKFGDDAFQKQEALIGQINALQKELETIGADPSTATSEARMQEYNDKAFQYGEMLKLSQAFSEDPMVKEREAIARIINKNIDKAQSLLVQDKFKPLKRLLQYQTSAQALQDAASKPLTESPFGVQYYGGQIGIKSLGRLAAGIGTLMQMAESLTVGDKKYTTWDVVEDYFRGVQQDTETLLPAPSQWSRPLITDTTTYGNYQIDIDKKKGQIQAVRDKKGQVLDVTFTDQQKAEILAQETKEKWNPGGLPYKAGSTIADLLWQIAATRGIGRLLPGQVAGNVRSTIAVTSSTMGSMAAPLYDEGLKLFDGDKRKASEYALATGTLVGLGANMFGLESRLAGMGGGFMDDILAGTKLGKAATPAKRAIEILKSGGGESFEETILENAIKNVTLSTFQQSPEMDRKEMVETAILSFAVGALFGAGAPIDNDVRSAAMFAAAQNPEGFKRELTAQIDAGNVVVPQVDGKDAEQAKAEFVATAVNDIQRKVATASIADDKAVEVLPLVEKLDAAKQELQKAEAAKVIPLVEAKKQEVEVINQQITQAIQAESEPFTQAEPESVEAVPVSQLEGKYVSVSGFYGPVMKREDGSYYIEDDEFEFELGMGDEVVAPDRVIDDQISFQDTEIGGQVILGDETFDIEQEIEDDAGNLTALTVVDQSGNERTITDKNIINKVVDAQSNIDDLTEIDIDDLSSQLPGELNDSNDAAVFAVIDSAPDELVGAMQGDVASIPVAIEWLDSAMSDLAKVGTDMAQQSYQDFKAIRDELENVAIEEEATIASSEQTPETDTELEEKTALDLQLDALEGQGPDADAAIESASIQDAMIDEATQQTAPPIKDVMEALDVAIDSIGRRFLNKGEKMTDEQLESLLASQSFTDRLPGVMVEVYGGRVTLRGSFGDIDFGIKETAPIFRRLFDIKRPTVKERTQIKHIVKKLRLESLTDEIAVGFASGVRISEANFNEHSDPNYLKDNPAIRFHFVSKKGNTKVDVWAAQLADKWGIDEQDVIQQIVDFAVYQSTGDYLRGRIADQQAGHKLDPMFDSLTQDEFDELTDEEAAAIQPAVIKATDDFLAGLTKQEVNDFETWIFTNTREDGSVDFESMAKFLRDEDFATSFIGLTKETYGALTRFIEAARAAAFGENIDQDEASQVAEDFEQYKPQQTPTEKIAEEQLNAAQKELAAARSARAAKARDLDKAIQADNADLFGERKSVVPGMIFDERADASRRSTILAPFDMRINVAEQNVKRLQQQLESIRASSAEPTLFDQDHIIKNGIPIPFADKASKFIDKFIKQTFYSKGTLTTEVFEANQDRVHSINAVLEKVRQTERRFKKALSKVHGKNITPEILQDLDAALKNPALVHGGIVLYRDGRPVETAIRATLRDMRLQVDSLSGELVALGIAQGDLAIKILDNQDTYLTRSYRVHDDKGWIDTVQKLPVWNKAVTWFKRNQVAMIQSLQDATLYYEGMVDAAMDREQKAIDRQLNTLPGTNERAAAEKAQKKAQDAQQFWHGKIREVEARIREEQVKYDNPEANLIAMLNEQQETMALAGVAKKGKLGSKDFGIFKSRKDIPKEVRDLFGEYEDPIANYAKSIYKQIHLIENAKFLAQVEREGLGKFLFTSPQGENTVKIAAESSKTMSPLSGYYTTPELAEAFARFNEPETVPGWLYPFVFLTSAAKYSKTILSPVTHIRNFYFNVFFHIANGRIRGAGAAMKTAWELVREDVDLLSKGDKAAEARLNDMIELGLVGDGATFKEMMELMNDVRKGWDSFASVQFGEKIIEKMRAVGKTAEQFYQAEDDFHKIMAFEMEKARYADNWHGKEFKSLTQQQQQEIEKKAASIVLATMPTYSLIPKNIQTLRRIPFLGTFVSFPYETLRTTKNTINLGIEELNDPRTRATGISRILGVMSATAGTFGLSALMFSQLGFDDEDEDNLRWFLPPWTENSVIFPVRRNGADISYIDVTSVIPQGYILSVFNAVFDERKTATEKSAAVWEALSKPFFSQDMTFKRISEAIENRTESGKDIAAADDPNHIRKRIIYASEVFVPGVISTGARITKSIVNPELDYYGRLYPEIEIGTLVTGVRVSPMNLEGSFIFKAKALAERARDDKQIYYRERNKQIYKDMPEEEKTKLLAPYKERSKAAWQVMYQEVVAVYKAAVKLGADPEALEKHLDGAGFNAGEREAIRAGMMIEARYDDDPEIRRRAKRRRRSNR